MSVKVEKLEGSMADLVITVSAEEFNSAIKRAYEKQKGKISIPGFRKGKVPLSMVEKLYGEAVFYNDAADDLINSTYPEEAEACGESIVSSPEISVEQIGRDKEFIYRAKVALKPPVSLGKYKGVEVEKTDIEVTEEEIDKEIENVRERNSRMEEVTDRPVKDGDSTTLDFEGFVDGAAFEGGKGTDYPLTIGSGSFIPGFEEQLVGAEIGVEKEVNVTFPENYQAAELAGKPAVFKCTVKKIREKILPEFNADFVSDISEFDTVEEYRADVKKEITARKEKEAKSAREDAVVKAIVEDAAIELPEPMIENQQRQMVSEFEQQLRMQGMQLSQYLQYTGGSEEQMLESMRPTAVNRIKTRLVMEEIVKAENITATEEDFDAEIQRMAEQYQMEADRVKEILGESGKKQTMEDLAVQKAVTFVVDASVEKKAAAKKSED